MLLTLIFQKRDRTYNWTDFASETSSGEPRNAEAGRAGHFGTLSLVGFTKMKDEWL